MRRLPRILLNAATAVSLVLCISTAVLWVRNVVIVYRWDSPNPAQRRVAGAGWYGKRFAVGIGQTTKGDRSGVEWYRAPAESVDWSGASFNRMGFVGVNNGLGWGLGVPGWLVPVVFAGLPAIRATRWAKRYGHRVAGRCPSCGYDLRATPARCPECGTAAGGNA